jgi:hypothetical protein
VLKSFAALKICVVAQASVSGKKPTQLQVFPSNGTANVPSAGKQRMAAKTEMKERYKLNSNFKLKARVSSSNPRSIQPVLEGLVTKGSVKKVRDEFVVEAEMEGTSAKELNRSLLSALRRVEKKTRLRAEWTSHNNATERFFDYVLKKTIRN